MKFNNILEAIGKTPLVRLNKIFNDHAFEAWAKCEFLNPGGSVKDRIGYQMVKDAEAAGRIKPGDTLIEPTSGNAGIGIALAGAVKGYKVVITMPEKMSREKQVVLEALGAEIIRTPTEAAWDAPESHISIAQKLKSLLPNSHILDQYSNPSNPSAHYNGTAVEIIEDLGQAPDWAIISAGTGGTISGIAKKLKEANPKVTIVGVDPVGSILGGGTDVGSYHVEGIGYDFFPKVFTPKIVDRWVKTTDLPSFTWARRAIAEEGLLCGGSSGSALYALSEVAKDIPKNSKVVVILPDGVRNYLSKFLESAWLKQFQFEGAAQAPLTIARDVLAKNK